MYRLSLRWNLLIAVGFVALQSALGQSDFIRYREDVAAYRHGLQELLAVTNASEGVKTYLRACMGAADLFGEPAKADQVARALRAGVAAKNVAFAEAAKTDLAANPLIGRGEDLFRARLLAYTDPMFIANVQAETELFNRKYFDEDDEAAANFCEAWLNGRVGLLRFKTDNDAWYRSRGVSAFEVTVRAEPVVMLSPENDCGVLLATGLLYNLFPSIETGGFGESSIAVKDTFGSKWIRRVGLRAGVGMDIVKDHQSLIAGGGMQIAVFTLWGVYHAEDSDWRVAVGMNDFTWVKEVLPFFGMK